MQIMSIFFVARHFSKLESWIHWMICEDNWKEIEWNGGLQVCSKNLRPQQQLGRFIPKEPPAFHVSSDLAV